ncbi:MAG TPA: DEAD/DEAH box helicase [Acidobacteriota bacterium]|nr:DEAD/DEAH box helicase [Acidobacteriota bacterium]
MSDIQSESATGFENFYLNHALMRGIFDAGFVSPRPIQVETIPATLQGRDILGLAETGTGKTAAFALPVLERLLTARQRGGPRVLIVAPTRELASQINEEIKALAKFTRVKTVTVFGGVSAQPQISALKQNPEIVVACPGRLLDLYGQGVLPLDQVETLILDEADHMFDMGFLPDIRRIIDALPAKRQNLMFSATMPKEIRILAKGILNDPHIVDLNNSRPVSTIEHSLYPVEGGDKISLLQHLCSEKGFVSAIVFTRTKYRAKRLAQRLARAGHRAVALQGNMSQSQRVKAMDGFRQRRFDILVATDIAARGIDVEQVSHVVNFDMPSTVDAYTHRIGRTGRAEREGKAYTFVTGDDRQLVGAVERRIGASIPRKTVEGFAAIRFPNNRFEDEQTPGQQLEKASTRPKKGTWAPGKRRRSRRPDFRRAS